MVRTRWILVAGLLLAAAGIAMTADDAPVGEGPAGIWQFRVVNGGRLQPAFWLLKLERQDGKWTGTIVDTSDYARSENMRSIPKVEDVSVTGDSLRFGLSAEELIEGTTFEGKLARDSKTILGSLSLGQQLVPARLEATKARNFGYELNKEIVSGSATNPVLCTAALSLLRKATEEKATPEEVRAWADKSFKASELYGPRWQREVGTRIGQILVKQDEFVPVALEYARRTERFLSPDEDPNSQIRVLDVLAAALKKTGKTEEAREVESRIDKLEARGDPEYLKKMPPLKVDPYAGRKAESDRAVLVELFTGAQCPPCVAADVAFDALAKAYKPTDIVLLEYHLHIPGPDPLANEATEARSEYYGKDIEGTPTTLFNGKAEAGGGGAFSDAGDKFKEYTAVINPLLDKPARAKLAVSALRKGDKIDITAEASDVDSSSDKVRLRLAVVEEEVRYLGGNRIRLHHHIVRAMPGGPDGVAVKDKAARQSITVDLNTLRDDLTRYLNNFEAKNSPFPNSRRPLNLKHLAVVAFVQDDSSKAVLQSHQVEVKSGE